MSGTPLSPSCTEPQEIAKLDGGCQHPLIQLQMNINRLYILYYYAQERVVCWTKITPFLYAALCLVYRRLLLGYKHHTTIVF